MRSIASKELRALRAEIKRPQRELDLTRSQTVILLYLMGS
jgi:hypothetical protein